MSILDTISVLMYPNCPGFGHRYPRLDIELRTQFVPPEIMDAAGQ